jgi:hypothetical protein
MAFPPAVRMPINEPRTHASSRAVEFLGYLLLVVSACMFLIAHRHHELLLERTQPNHTIQRLQTHTINDGNLVSDILRGSEHFPSNGQIRFRPGTIAMSTTETLQHCHVNMNTYKAHFDKLFSIQVSVSDKYKLIYRNIPKSASSSSRTTMQDYFDGEDRRMKHYQLNKAVLEQNYTLISFIRDPLERFYSSYDEAFLRMGPWWGAGELAEEKPALHKVYMSNKHKVDPYPYLYEGMTTLDDFRKMYCPGELLEQKNGYLKCVDVETIDQGNLTSRFEQFVRDYDGTDPFDNHLKLQVAFLLFNSKSHGAPLPVSAIYNASSAHEEWGNIAREKGVILHDDEMTHGRKRPRRFNLNLVRNATKQKICKILALDYCCLNLELPDVCRSYDDASGVFCTLEQRDITDQSGLIFSKLVIQSYRSYS